MKTRLKTKTCANDQCKKEFTQQKPMQKVCSPLCAAKYAEQSRAKKEKKQARADLAKFKRENKPISQWIAEAQKSVNAYIKLRDHDKPCISCGKPDTGYNGLRGQMFDAGHYRSRGAASHLRFNTNNIYKQCVRCNRNLSGNVVEFRKNLVELKGEEFVLALEHDNQIRKFDREYCERVKRIFNKKTRLAKKRLGIE